ncbi:hypothetical protein Tco_0722012 [Tanacetum coccineum]
MTNIVPAPPTDPPKALDGSRRWGILLKDEPTPTSETSAPPSSLTGQKTGVAKRNQEKNANLSGKHIQIQGLEVMKESKKMQKNVLKHQWLCWNGQSKASSFPEDRRTWGLQRKLKTLVVSLIQSKIDCALQQGTRGSKMGLGGYDWSIDFESRKPVNYTIKISMEALWLLEVIPREGEPSVHKDPAFDDLDDDACRISETYEGTEEKNGLCQASGMYRQYKNLLVYRMRQRVKNRKGKCSSDWAFFTRYVLTLMPLPQRLIQKIKGKKMIDEEGDMILNQYSTEAEIIKLKCLLRMKRWAERVKKDGSA